MSHEFRLNFLTHVEGHVDVRSLYRRMIDLAVAAEELGFDGGWIAQHHFEDGRSGSGAGASPLVLHAAIAEHTKTLRLGTAVITVPLESPLRLAEDAATLDTLSGGRVELGVSSGFDPLSFAAFGVSIDEKRELTSKGLDILNRALAGEALDSSGRARLQPAAPGLRNRIWQGIFSHDGARYAAAAGSNLLLNRATYGYDERTDIVQRGWADSYLEAWQNNPRNLDRTPRIGLSRLIYPAADRATAKQHLRPGVEHFVERQVRLGKFPPGLDLDGYLARLHAFVGHPDEIVEQLSDERTLPIATDILCQVNPGVLTFDQHLRALELIATEIAPALGWKPKKESNVVQLAQSKTSASIAARPAF